MTVGLAASAHHSEHVMPEGGRLFVNGLRSGTSFVIDLRDPMAPSVAATFTTAHGLLVPPLLRAAAERERPGDVPNGKDGERVTGGIVELDPKGRPLRSASAAHPDYPEIRPYSLAILAESDLVVTTTADMRVSPFGDLADVPEALAIDRTFGQEGIVLLGDREWPHGETGPAVPHGVVLSRSRSE